MRWLPLVLVACSAPVRPPEPRLEPPGADREPTLEIASPERGTFADGNQVIVTGRAIDDGPVKVTVNDVPAVIDRDGSFTATLRATPGVMILETHAIDRTAHDVRDIRAVLVGPFARTDGSARGAVGARLGRTGFAALGKLLAAQAQQVDYTAAAQPLNPVYEKSGCLGARLDVTDVAFGQIDVVLDPKPRTIEATIAVDNIVVKLDVRYRAACIGGNATMTVRTKALVRGNLAATVTNGRIHTALPDPLVVLDDFRVDVANLPSALDFLVKTVVRAGVEHSIAKAIETKLPPLADARLADLLASPPQPQLIGRSLRIDIVPNAVEIATLGLVVAAHTSVVVAGGEGGRYVTAPIASGAGPGGDAGVWIAADTINQLLAGLWAAHAFERSLPRSKVGPLAMLLDEQVQSIELTLSLPPTVSADSKLELAIGDLILSARDASGGEVQRFAVSLRSDVQIKAGELGLADAEPVVHAQLLAQSAKLTRPLDGAAVEGVVKGAWSLTAGMIDDALAHVPIPGAGSTVALRSATARGGAILLELAVK